MKNNAKYSAVEIFEMFKEEHRLCSPLDFMAYANYELTPNSLIWEWRDARDLLRWEELSANLNKQFRIDVSKSRHVVSYYQRVRQKFHSPAHTSNAVSNWSRLCIRNRSERIR